MLLRLQIEHLGVIIGTMKKDRQPTRYEVYAKPGMTNKEVARVYIGVKKGNNISVNKTVYRHFETIRRKTSIRIPKPLFDLRTYIAKQNAERQVSRLNSPRA